MNNTGSFGGNLGGLPNLRAAMERRGQDASVLDQITNAAPGPSSPVAGAAPQGPDMQVASSMSSTPMDPDQEIALTALADTVKTNNKIKKAAAGLR